MSRNIYWVDSAMSNKIHGLKLALCILGTARLHTGKSKRSYVGKNLVSDGHFCKSFCPAQPKISISGDLKHCYHVLTYPD